jgi:hypothetical protein
MSDASQFYATVDNVKIKLRIPLDDKTIDAELQLYAEECNAWIETEIRRIVGNHDDNGDPIDINFTIISNPEIDVDIRARADDMLEGKFRQKTTNDNNLWKSSCDELRDYLRDIFGWAAGESHQTNPTFVLDPETGTALDVITITAIHWAVFEQVKVSVGGISVVTTPDPARADDGGEFTATFQIPSETELGTATVKLLGENIPRGRTEKTRNFSYAKLVVT